MRACADPRAARLPAPGKEVGGQAPGRDDVVQGDGQVPDDGQDREEQSGDDQDQIARQARRETLGQQLDLLIGRVGPHQARPDRVPPQDHQQRGGHQEADAVERDRDAFGVVLADVVREQPGGERQKRDHHEQQQVQAHECGVGTLEVLGDRVVPEPGRADGGEAGHIGQVRGPQVLDRAQQVPAGVAGDRDIEDQQGDGDGDTPSLKASSRPVRNPRRRGSCGGSSLFIARL